MPTLRQIADLVGVSPSTVSRALSGELGVGEQTRREIQEAVTKLDRPTSVAGARRGRPRRKQQLRTVAIVCADHAQFRRRPFHAPILNAAVDAVPVLGARLLLIDWPNDRQEIPKELEAADAAVCIGEWREHVALLAARLPTVTLDIQHLGTGADGVVADYRRGAFECVRHLLDRGHRQITVASALKNDDERFGSTLYDGARRAFDLADISPWEGLVGEPASTPEDGYRIAKILLSRSEDERPTAIFGSDHAMLGVLSAAHDLGVAVPERLAVVGVDGIELGQYSVPKLSTVRVDKEALGRLAVERALWRAAQPSSPPCQLLVACTFIERESCCPQTRK
jgi:DNA-binding LacI/PurR family transcriptional regulator